MGLFSKDSNLPRVAEVLKTKLGLTLVKPAKDVVTLLDYMTPRDLNFLDSIATVEGMQELFRARSIRAVVDPQMHLVALFLVDASELEQEIKTEHARVKVMHVETSYTPLPAAKPTPAITPPAPPAGSADAESDAARVQPRGLEHLDAFEHLCAPMVDFLLKHGQLTSGDKEVLRKIQPATNTFEGRIAALERWQTEVGRRLRSIRVPKAQQMVLGADDPSAPRASAQETLVHRFEALMVWMGKLIKAVEVTGYRYHDKPMWLPH